MIAVGAASWGFTVDDAWVVARYADRLASGHGYTMNDGAPTDGVTGPLWLLPLVLARLLGLDAMAVGKGLGLVCAAVAAGWAADRVRERAGGRRAAWVTALLVGVQPTLGIWGAAGLETGLATLCATAALLGATARPRPQGTRVGLAIAALAWLRPETAAMALVALLAVARRGPGRRRAAALAAIGAGLVVALRVSMFGSPLPLSSLAKPADLGLGATYVGGGLLATGALIGLGVALARWRWLRADDRAVTLALLAHLAAVVVAGGDWMPGFRLLAPALPAYAYLIGAVACRLRAGRGLGAAMLAITLSVVPALDAAVQLPRAREAGRCREQHGRPLADALARFRVVALVDVGYLPWRAGFEVVDLGGITDPDVARMPGGHLGKIVDAGWLSSRDPDAIVLHATRPPAVEGGALRTLSGYPVERRVASLPWVRERYVVERVAPYAPDYFYVVLVRRGAGLTRPAGSPASGPSRPGEGGSAPAR